MNDDEFEAMIEEPSDSADPKRDPTLDEYGVALDAIHSREAEPDPPPPPEREPVRPIALAQDNRGIQFGKLAKFLVALTFIAALLGGMEVHPSSQAPFLVFGSQSGLPVAIKATSNALWVSIQSVASPLLFPDGTSGAPAIAFASEPTLGFWRSAAATITNQGKLIVSSDFTVNGTSTIANGQTFRWNSNLVLSSPAAGAFNVAAWSGTTGSQLKVDALPTVTACGAGTPSVAAGSTPLAGAVVIGTTAVSTCTITFGGTAFPSAPACTSNTVTASAANVRAIGATATTTQLVLVPASAWADSSIVSWICISPK